MPSRNRQFLRTRELSWDDNTVLTRQFSALVPAFDPRPGRPIIQAVARVYLWLDSYLQTIDLNVPPPGSPSQSFTSLLAPKPPSQELALFLVDPAFSGYV
jgi:hypothetical protein